MSLSPVLGLSRPHRIRVRRAGVAALCVLGTMLGARAQQPETAQRQAQAEQQETPPAPATAEPERPLEQPPAAEGQAQLPPIVVSAPKSKSKTKTPPKSGAPQQTAQQTDAPTPAQAALDSKMRGMDQARDNLLPKIGATTYTITREAIVDMPQGDNTPFDKVILQMPGVSYDSAVSNPSFHVRNEYANVQYRINGVIIPEGVSGLGPVIDTNFISSLSLLTGTLPAQYGLRTAGVLDITSRSYAVPGGEVSLYGGSRQTFIPSFDYGGSFGNTEYFVTARGNWNALGLENATSSLNAEHDYTEQGKFFGYSSTLLNESTRFSLISAVSYSEFQIPNNPNQTPLGDFGPLNYNSSSLNENEHDTYVVNIATLQKGGTDGDAQFAALREDQLHSRCFRRPRVQQCSLKRDPGKLTQRHAVRHLLPRERPAHFAGRLRGERRTNQCQQHFDGPPRRPRHRGHIADAAHHRRSKFIGWLEHWSLRPGRMETDQPADSERRPAVRPIISVCRRQPAQPAGRAGL